MSSVGNSRRNARKRIPPAIRRRALELSRDGCTEAILVANGLTIDLLVGSGRARYGESRARRSPVDARSRSRD